MKKIYTVTYLNANYGSVMQAFALQRKLVELGASPVIVLHDRRSTLLTKVKKCLKFLKPIKHYSLVMRFKTENLQRLFYKKKIAKLERFIHDNIKTISVKNTTELAGMLNKDTILLAGSDQIWSMINGKLSDWYTFYWQGMPKSIIKVSYAASTGLSGFSEEQKNEYVKKLSDFNSISFREDQARDCLEPFFHCTVRCDVDPTLLYDESFWDTLSSERMCNRPYIFVYMLRPDTRLIDMAKQLARSKNCEIIYTGLLPDRFKGVKTVYNAGVNEFLSYIKYADYVITNSFHGTVFSLLFKRQFVNVEIASTSSRARNLLKIAHIENRMINTKEELKILEEPIDYETVDTMINTKREESIRYLKQICKLTTE